ncbi:MAG: tetratricopeptide repeat protein, partial [Bacteroidota bacterium]
YDQRIANFKQEGYVLGRKGSDMLKYRRKEPRAAYDVLAKSLELQGNKMEAGAMVYMYQALYYSYKKEKAQVEELFDVFSKVMPVIDYGEANGKNDKAKGRYTNARTKIEEIFSKVADCPSLVSIFTPKFEATPDDKELLKTILKLMDRKDCSDEALYTDAAVKLNELEPSAEAAYGIAQSKAKKDNCAEAVTYYKQAAELTEDEELKSKSLLNAAKCYLFMGQGQAARTYAQKALGVKGSLGEAYLVIANAYAKSAKSCGDNNCTNRSAYWAAVDKCVRAKSVDPSVAAKANKLIAGFSAQFPKKEDCFFHSINEGDSYTVGCWINETTTVRVRQ